MLIDRIGELPIDQRMVIAYDKMSIDEAAAMHVQFNDAGFHPIAKANSLATRPGLDVTATCFHALGSELMFDPKYFDTDETMRSYITQAANATDLNAEVDTKIPPLLVTIHASNRMKALTEAAFARNETVGEFADVLNILGITVLTSFDTDDVVSIYGEGATAQSKFVDFAHQVNDAGLQGLVSSGEELLAGYKYEELNRLIRVVPGIKLPEGPNTKGQSRLYTPDRAFAEGAHFVVLGRAVTAAENPVAALETAVELAAKEV